MYARRVKCRCNAVLLGYETHRGFSERFELSSRSVSPHPSDMSATSLHLFRKLITAGRARLGSAPARDATPFLQQQPPNPIYRHERKVQATSKYHKDQLNRPTVSSSYLSPNRSKVGWVSRDLKHF